MIEYIAAISFIGLLIAIVALVAERREITRLKERLYYLEKRYRQLFARLNEYANEVISLSLDSSARPEFTPEEESNDIDSKILRLHMKGYSYGQIAKELGVSKSTVYRRLKKILKEKKPQLVALYS